MKPKRCAFFEDDLGQMERFQFGDVCFVADVAGVGFPQSQAQNKYCKTFEVNTFFSR